MKAKDFEERFDNGESVMPFVDFPAWMVDALDREAEHLGVTRQALVKVWIANCLTRDAHTAHRP